jgi:hypothetical protein
VTRVPVGSSDAEGEGEMGKRVDGSRKRDESIVAIIIPSMCHAMSPPMPMLVPMMPMMPVTR